MVLWVLLRLAKFSRNSQNADERCVNTPTPLNLWLDVYISDLLCNQCGKIADGT